MLGMSHAIVKVETALAGQFDYLNWQHVPNKCAISQKKGTGSNRGQKSQHEQTFNHLVGPLEHMGCVQLSSKHKANHTKFTDRHKISMLRIEQPT